MRYTAIFKKSSDPEGYIGWIEEIPGANTQGRTLDEARANLHEALDGVLSIRREIRHTELSSGSVLVEPFEHATAQL